MARSLHCLTAALPLILAGCFAPQYEPTVIAPPPQVPRPEPAFPGRLAVVDFEDERPAWQRQPGAINTFSGDAGDQITSFWWYDGHPSGPLPGDLEGQLHLRVTGEGSLLWYPFPYGGTNGPRSMDAARGIADYVAHLLAERHVASSVIRVASVEAAAEAGAQAVVSGELRNFVGVFRERDQDEPRTSDDNRRFDLGIQLELPLRLTSTKGQQQVWEADLQKNSESQVLHLFDHLDFFRSSQIVPTPSLDQWDMPAYALLDLTHHLERELSRQAQAAVENLKSYLDGVGTPDTP